MIFNFDNTARVVVLQNGDIKKVLIVEDISLGSATTTLDIDDFIEKVITIFIHSPDMEVLRGKFKPIIMVILEAIRSRLIQFLTLEEFITLVEKSVPYL